MLIIAGYLEVDATRRDEFVAAHHDLLRRGRVAPGCLDLAISADSLNPQRVNNFERWESREHLEAWRQVAAQHNSLDPLFAAGADHGSADVDTTLQAFTNNS